MVNFGESDKIEKVNGIVDKLNTCHSFSCNISFSVQRRTSSDKTFYEIFYILQLIECRKSQKNFSLIKFFFE